jgi:hypothetical protein
MKQKTHYFLDLRVLAIFGVIAALPLVVGFFLILGSARVSLGESIGQDFANLAEHAASSVDEAVYREVLHISVISTSPDFIEGARASNRGYSQMANWRERLEAQEATWSELTPDHPRVKSLLDSKVSRHLSNIVAASELYHEMFLVDYMGAVVAASKKPLRYYYGNRPWFRKSIVGTTGKGELAISDIRRFREIDTNVIAMSWPVREETAGQPLGVLLAVVDTQSLFQSVTGLRFGENGHALLVQENGEVLAGMVSERSLADRYHAMDDYKRAVKESRAYFVTEVTTGSDSRGAELIGYGRSQLAFSYPELDWVVMVEQPLAEAHAPIAAVTRNIILYFLAMGLAVVALAVYVSFKLERPVTDIEVDLHHAPSQP